MLWQPLAAWVLRGQAGAAREDHGGHGSLQCLWGFQELVIRGPFERGQIWRIAIFWGYTKGAPFLSRPKENPGLSLPYTCLMTS